ncbi:phosphatidylinositol 4:5-bisphosphate 3-kinase catalytic subunit beta isoform-like isoform X1 [Leptotrombidium deliense]|uniref:Phosphatidylinositol 4:5-bisphosphate 3-kinase catalytic subunit beta isoform-like isoform X1 n=1 Tax=Leptotrombidium deliense TaxID=299467 RepID=A0A443SUN0_9ACAR|nr:phosphatidylinositol 4:5-bisphosphate 3-kinase catalytic subunit beta isoform-like isoform X1 [Leptotrombidium deliense]
MDSMFENQSMSFFNESPGNDLNKEVSTGTTLVAVEFADGVVIGADSRTSQGSFVHSRMTDKLTRVTDHIYCCRSGSAADTQAIADVISYHIEFYEMESGEQPLVSVAANLFRDMCYKYRDQLTAGILCAGWDKRHGGQVVYKVLQSVNFIVDPGSGSTYITGYIDSNYRKGMTKDECIDFVTKGVALAILRDGSSGGVIRLGIITKDGAIPFFKTANSPQIPMTLITEEFWLNDDIDRKETNLDVLTPNGLLISLTVNSESTIFHVKEDVFYEVQKQPLFGLLKDPQSYVFTCVNITTAEQEELDENRRVCDVRPLLGILRLIERKNDKNEKQQNAKIGLLIGKGLHEFDALKSPEVNDFRWRTRLLCEEFQNKRFHHSWLQKAYYQYPPRIETSDSIPEYVLTRLDKNKNLNIEIRFWSAKTIRGVSVSYQISVKDLINKANATLKIPELEDSTSCDEYTLKVCGQEEYFLENLPLIQYKYIREMLVCNKVPSVIIFPIKNITIAEQVTNGEGEFRGRSPSLYSNASRRKVKPISSFTINEKLLLNINGACRINCSKNARLAVQVGLYHGNELLCKAQSTVEESVKDSECTWDECLEFGIDIRDVPRMAKFCFVIYETVSRSRKGSRTKVFRSPIDGDVQANPLAWANTTVFDYKSNLRTGTVTLRLWSYSNDTEADDMLNPLGTCFSLCNPSFEEATSLTITFNKYSVNDVPIEFLSLEWIIEETQAMECEVTAESRKARHASKTYLERLQEICDRDPLNEMHEQDKELLWFLRDDCRQLLPHSLPHLLHSVKWNKHEDMMKMMTLLYSWPELETETALELLDFAYADCHVRAFAVKCLRKISDDDLQLYLLQLVQALKYESYLHSDLVIFLLERALQNQHIGHHLFWLLRSEMHEVSVNVLFGLILEAYCRGATTHITALMKQTEALSKLKQMNEYMRQEANKRKDRDKLKSLMHDIINQQYYKEALSGFINPLNPHLKLGTIKTEKCRFMDSKMKPLWMVFSSNDYGSEDICVMFKNGDDLRQDMLTLQMIRIMDKIWKDEGLDLRMTPYRVIATDNRVGLIEIVLNAQTIANVQTENRSAATSVFTRKSLFEWLKDHNPDEASISKAIEEFTLSCAGYCVATYVLGIADRHNDNIMVKTNGQLLHIDFGHILGKFKEKFGIRRERVPFVLTHDFVYVIKQGDTGFKKFQTVCEEAFTILRRKGSFIISLFAMMLSSGLPELSSAKDLEYLRETLVLNLTEKDALQHFRSKFNEAFEKSWKTSFNWLAHNIAKGN